MGYQLKTKFMKKIIAKKQKAQPFDFEAGENFVLPAEADPTINNSYYFSAHGVESKESLYLRLGIRNCHSEVWFFYSDGAQRYALKTMFFQGNIPLKVFRCEQGWRVIYQGELTRGDGKQVLVEFEGTYTAEQAPVDFFSHMPPVRMAKAMAGEKWTKTFFAEVQKNNQVHYEQTGRLCGFLKIDGQSRPIDLPCVRDHSFGKRDWNYMNNHLWLMAVNETSQLNFSMVSYPAMSLLEVGNFKAGNSPMAYVLRADYDRTQLIKGRAPDQLALSLELDNQRKLSIHVKKTDEEAYLFQDGDYCLIEGIAEFTIDGEAYRGILEVGFNKEQGRFFNGKEIRKLNI